jgi:hypothetical protein
MFKRTPEERAEDEALAAALAAARVDDPEDPVDRRSRAEDLANFRRGPVGRAEEAFVQGDHVFQFAHSVMSQKAIIISMVGSTTAKTSADPSEILNAICRQGWELITASFVFVVEGEQSRDKFMSSGQNVAVKGQTMGYYLFRRCPSHVVQPESS